MNELEQQQPNSMVKTSKGNYNIASEDILRQMLSAVQTSMATRLLDDLNDPEKEMTPAMVTAIANFLKDNGARLGTITKKSPLGNLLDSVPFTCDDD